MFTGIIEAVGNIKNIQPIGGDFRLTVNTQSLDLGDVQLGDSIATNGICLTVTDFGTQYFCADVSAETLRRTTLGTWQVGKRVNLEKALLPTTRLGGHIVSGHVDGIGKITQQKKDARSMYFEITAPHELSRYLAEKGSITVDGISLTINNLKDNIVSLNLVPHSADKTTILDWKIGSQVNLEVDIIARYLERLLMPQTTTQTAESNIDMAFLQQAGFLRARR